MEIKLFEANNGGCPYLKDQVWMSYMFQAENLDPKLYEVLIDKGFRRNGLMFYKNNCPNCDQCKPIRVLAGEFKLSSSQKKVLKKNDDLSIKTEPISFDRGSYELYQKYSYDRFGTQTTLEDYFNFLVQSSVETVMMKYYLDKRLVGVGWVDILDNSLSSVYFAYDMEYSKKSLGVFSVLKEIELCRKMKKDYLQLGFWVKGCKTMHYKTGYYPHELLDQESWVRIDKIENQN
ncbi:MAG: arginyltransferase [Deltaproteobacteria bacterium]|nr:arginyltransferase [Deltaproteobacteria bacterium]